ncbi:hypothetical protein ACHAWF_003836 [Thalassiosira exigua]
MTMTTASAAATGSNNLLDEFCSSSLSPSLLQSLLHRLFSHPKIFYGFVDVLKLPSVRETMAKMDEGKRAAIVRTVELFAFGTVKEYYELREKDEVWSLNDAQLEKLRMLTVASVALDRMDGSRSSGDVVMADGAPKAKRKSKKKRKDRGALSIPYSLLATELRIPDDGAQYDEKANMRQLEDLLIQCIYSNVIAAKLDQSSRSLRIEPHLALSHEASVGGSSKGSKKEHAGGVHGSVLSRDLNTTTPESTNAEVSRMASALENFLKQSNSLLSTLEQSSKASAANMKEDELRWREVQKLVEGSPSKLREAASAGGGGGSGMMIGMGGEPMEVVDLVGRRQVKRSKGGHSMMGSEGGVRFR